MTDSDHQTNRDTSADEIAQCPDCDAPDEVMPGVYQATRCDRHRREVYSL